MYWFCRADQRCKWQERVHLAHPLLLSLSLEPQESFHHLASTRTLRHLKKEMVEDLVIPLLLTKTTPLGLRGMYLQSPTPPFRKIRATTTSLHGFQRLNDLANS